MFVSSILLQKNARLTWAKCFRSHYLLSWHSLVVRLCISEVQYLAKWWMSALRLEGKTRNVACKSTSVNWEQKACFTKGHEEKSLFAGVTVKKMLLVFSSLKFWWHWKLRYASIKLLYISVSDTLRCPYFVIQLNPSLFLWKSPNLDDSTFRNYWIMSANLSFSVCQWPCEVEDMKIIWQDKVANIFCTGVCAASLISLQRPSPEKTFSIVIHLSIEVSYLVR